MESDVYQSGGLSLLTYACTPYIVLTAFDTSQLSRHSCISARANFQKLVRRKQIRRKGLDSISWYTWAQPGTVTKSRSYRKFSPDAKTQHNVHPDERRKASYVRHKDR